MEPPQFPAGPFEPPGTVDPRDLAARVAELAALPAQLAAAVAGLGPDQLDTKYRNWTIRQIVHHLADSHTQAVTRCRWALTEDHPTIKPYDESRWAELDDARLGPIEPSLAILTGLHARWVELLRSLADEQWVRTFLHPEGGRVVPLTAMPELYAWHGRHHLAQILWRRDREGWTAGPG